MTLKISINYNLKLLINIYHPIINFLTINNENLFIDNKNEIYYYIGINDTNYHLNYIPTEIPPTDHLTYQIVTWIIFSIVLLILTLSFIRYLVNKNKKINIMHTAKEESNKIQDEIINEVVISKTFLQAKQEEINDLDEILQLDQLDQDELFKNLKNLLINLNNDENSK